MVKGPRIRWSRRALEEFEEGLGFIAQFNPEAAHRFRIALLEALDQVRRHPGSARMVPEEEDHRVRELLRPPFRLIFELLPQELRILSIRRMERAPLERKDLR